ncbi:thioredoxin [Muricauda sp. NFXS6]|uniref:thioredoxin n=1 Tax=Allomuricauda sp. NFXS6 TaxID=2819094 RepID=UPI0032E01771
MKGNFANLINNDQLTLVDFSAEWCGPCKMLAPILKQVKDEMGDSLKVVKIDVDKNQNLANTYQVRGVPTLIFFKNGEQLWRKSGVLQKGEIVQLAKSFL